MKHFALLALICLFVLLLTGAAQAAPEKGVLFDDFSYTGVDDPAFTKNGWIARAEPGWPGVTGATWQPENITFSDDPELTGNRLAQMTSETDGTGVHTQQTQLCQQRKFFEGTYATRVRFTDKPLTASGGDQIVETFYMISPLKAPLDPDYSEMDNEYLPNGGWGIDGQVLHFTTWKTVRLEPWLADNANNHVEKSFAGWHALVMQVAQGEVKYYVDGELMATHGDKYYPRVPMSINYNLWFIQGGLAAAGDVRQYVEQIDWLYYAADTVLSPDDVEAKVAGMRESSTPFLDTVALPEPLPAICNM